MNYDNAFIEKVKAFGVLGYPPHEIIYLVKPEDPDQFLEDMENPKHEIYKAYHEGKVTGQYTSDKALFDAAKNNNTDANEKLNQRQQKKKIDTTIHERFHI